MTTPAHLAAAALLAAPACMSQTTTYLAERAREDGIEIVRLADSRRGIEVRIVPSIGNNAYRMTVNGHPVLWSPYQSLAEFKAKPVQLGNPFLAPWANRLSEEAFHANGKRYRLNPDLKNYRLDGNQQPIHGLVTNSPDWRVTAVEANAASARATSRLEFWRHPDWMAQFPFAHTIEMTYRLAGGALEVETAVENHAREPMPLSLGYHTYYQLTESPREQWRVLIPAREQVVLSGKLVPTGERKPMPFAKPLSMKDVRLDDVFTALERDPQGRAEFRVEGGRQSISVLFGPKYLVGVVWAPPGREFLCFEPMTGVTNAFNLAHEGKYPELQTVPPGGVWRESFWIRPSGF